MSEEMKNTGCVFEQERGSLLPDCIVATFEEIVGKFSTSRSYPDINSSTASVTVAV